MTAQGLNRLFLLIRDQPSSGAWTPSLEAAYQVCLAEYDDAEMLRAAATCLKRQTFRPSIAEIIAAAAEAVAGPTIAPEEVWAWIRQAMNTYGLYGVERNGVRLPGNPPWPNETVRAVVRACGGWEAVCTWPAEQGSLEGVVMRQARSHVDRAAEEARRMLDIPPAERPTRRIEAAQEPTAAPRVGGLGSIGSLLAWADKPR